MKKIIFAFLILLAVNLPAQEKQIPYIEVTGSAEMTVVPDQIELEITLYSPSNSKKSIEELDKKLYDALKAHDIPESVVSFVSIENPYYWYYWWWEYRHYYDTKTYKVKLDCRKYDLAFINDLGADNIRNIRITSSTHSMITEYRRQVKVEAMVAAKEKASALLEAIGQKAGKVIEVIEMPESANANYWYNPYSVQNVTSNSIVSQPSSGYSGGGESYVPSIKLRFEIQAKFEIL